MPGLSRIRRSRPLLGTYFQVTIEAGSEEQAHAAAERAFAAAQKVQKLMNAHDPESDVSRLAREAHLRPVLVHPWTMRVLRASVDLSVRSYGAFDVSIGSRMKRLGLLPKFPGEPDWEREPQGESRSIRFGPGNRVRFQRAMAVDLGGIAKGFAVDRALEAARQPGVRTIIVEAGGDLRIESDQPQPLWARDPWRPGFLLELPSARRASVASSGGFLAERGEVGVPIFTGAGAEPGRARSRGRRAESFSATVCARTCMEADALAKVAILAPAARARSILNERKARAWIFAREHG